MVKRCGYFTKDNILYRKDVLIDWKEEMSYQDKKAIVLDIHSKLQPECGHCFDVTSYSNSRFAKQFSPYNLKVDDTCFKDAWDMFKQGVGERHIVEGMYDWVYLNMLTEEQVYLVMTVDGFTDFYYNPDKVEYTQARTLAMLKLLIEQNKVEYLADPVKFCHWYIINNNPYVIIPREEKSYAD